MLHFYPSFCKSYPIRIKSYPIRIPKKKSVFTAGQQGVLAAIHREIRSFRPHVPLKIFFLEAGEAWSTSNSKKRKFSVGLVWEL